MEIIRDQDIGLILIAMDMEKRENFNLLSLIKMSPLAQKIPVIVVSPANLPGTKKKVYDIGAELFMEKITASPKKVVEAVQKLFEEACS
ncbi:MAG: hypothetical protein GWN86_26950 [Desulfobacterales bacterium]|nr:hypothetical protein [Desulfobacterales bacterium]